MSADLHQPSTPAPPPVGAPDDRPTSVAAIVGLIGSFVCWPVGLVASVIGLLHTRGGAKKGRGIALAGVIISAVTAVVTVVVLVLGVQAFRSASSGPELTDAGEALQEARSADDSAGAAAAPDASSAPVLDPFDDVVIDTCEHDDSGALTATATVINPTEQTASYTVVIGFDDMDGNVMGRASGQVSGVVPGGDAQIDLVGAGTDLPDDMECYVDDVVRLPA